MAPPEKTLIILRHAHRDKTDGRDRDNGLSEKGQKQAKAIRKFYEKRFGKRTALLLSSNKLRCRETLIPLATFLRSEVETHPLLTEQGGVQPKEGTAAFHKRVIGFCEEWKRMHEPCVVICTHGDWIPIALEALVGTSTELKKGGWAEISLKNGSSSLQWLAQEL